MADQPQPKSSLMDVINYLKLDEGGIRGMPTPTAEMKNLSAYDRIELRLSLDKVRGL